MGADKNIVFSGGTPGNARPKIKKTYFIFDESSNAIKIGRAEDPHRRLKQLQTGSVGKLKLLATINEDRERELHRRFNHVHQRAEWFLASKSLLAYIAEIKKERI